MQTTDRQFLEQMHICDSMPDREDDVNFIALIREREEHAHTLESYTDMLTARDAAIAKLKRRCDWQNLALFALTLIVAYMAGRG